MTIYLDYITKAITILHDTIKNIMKRKTMNINIKNINVNYVDVGQGESTVLLLHGWGSNIVLFDSMISYLRDKNRVIALDMPGFGGTGEPSFAMNVDDYTDFVLEFIEKLNLKKISVAGHSFGGRVIIKMANRKLNFELDKIVLIDAAGIRPKKSLAVQIKVKSFKTARFIFENTPLGKMYPNFINNMRKKSGSADYNMASQRMREILVKVVNEDLTSLLSNIKNKTLLIWGDKDDATPISDAHIMNKLIPNSRLVIVENTGHYSFLENPTLVNSEIQKFLV